MILPDNLSAYNSLTKIWVDSFNPACTKDSFFTMLPKKKKLPVIFCSGSEVLTGSFFLLWRENYYFVFFKTDYKTFIWREVHVEIRMSIPVLLSGTI